MILFEHDGSKYITINGKSFYLLQGYSREKGDFIFVQVAGKYHLFKEDLPDTKKWKLVKTKWQENIIYTLFNQEYHNYQSDRVKGKLLFPSPSSKGSFFLLLKFVNEKYSFKISDAALIKIADESHYDVITSVLDEGNLGGKAYMLNFYDGAEDRLESIITNN